MTSINPKDLEAISAYLDQALAPRERANFEARLKREPHLRTELRSLEQTRRVLRATPHKRAPRNFTLTPEMAGEAAPGRSRFYSFTRLTFTLASFLFMIVMVGNYAFDPAALAVSESATAFDVQEEAAIEPLEAAVPEAVAAGEIEAMQAADNTAVEEAGEPVGGAADPAGESASGTEESLMAPPVGEGQTEQPSGGGGLLPEPTPEEMQSIAPPDESQSMVGEEAPAAAGETDRSVEETPQGAEEAPTSKLPPPEVESLPVVEEAPATGAQNSPFNPWALPAYLTGFVMLASGALMLVLRRRS